MDLPLDDIWPPFYPFVISANPSDTIRNPTPETIACREAAGGDTCEGVVVNSVCPTVYEALGGAAGYISLLFSLCVAAYSFIGKKYHGEPTTSSTVGQMELKTTANPTAAPKADTKAANTKVANTEMVETQGRDNV